MATEVLPSFTTGNVSITATLLTLGFNWFDEAEPCTNTYGRTSSIPKDTEGRPLKPGKVQFLLNQHSGSFPTVEIGDVLEEWKNEGSDVELDQLLAPTGDDSPEVADLKRKALDLLPLAITSYLKGCLYNRKQAAGAFRHVKPMRGWKEGGTTFLLTEGATDKMKEDLGV